VTGLRMRGGHQNKNQQEHPPDVSGPHEIGMLGCRKARLELHHL